MNGKTILCIEDNPTSRLLIRKILEQNGYKVYEADNGIEGISIAKKILPDLILMDINIPGMDGYESTTLIKGLPELKNIPVVALTAQADEGDRERSLISGCDGYMTKPIIAKNLIKKIESCLNGAKDNIQFPAERLYLKEYSHRLVSRLEEKINELAVKNKQLERYSQDMEDVYVGIICSLMNALEQKDRYTSGHSARVTQFALSIGRRMGLASEELNTLTRAGELHDVGKLIIDLSSINKSDRLNEQEWKRMKEHPIIGAHILSPLSFLSKEIPIVLHHHERWDGRGYPDHLEGKDLDLLTCIITAADSYDAMTSERFYKQGITGRKEVIQEIQRCTGSQFCTEVADTLVTMIEQSEIS
ncbi:MAG: HD domain-containing phosphohydrolase [bacterium]